MQFWTVFKRRQNARRKKRDKSLGNPMVSGSSQEKAKDGNQFVGKQPSAE